jgi:hypothetical protein
MELQFHPDLVGVIITKFVTMHDHVNVKWVCIDLFMVTCSDSNCEPSLCLLPRRKRKNYMLHKQEIKNCVARD